MEAWFDRLSVDEMAMAMEEEGLLEEESVQTIRQAVRRQLIAPQDERTRRALLLHYANKKSEREMARGGTAAAAAAAAARLDARMDQGLAGMKEKDAWLGIGRRQSDGVAESKMRLYFMKDGFESAQRTRSRGQESKRRGSETVRRREEAFKWNQTLQVLEAEAEGCNLSAKDLNSKILKLTRDKEATQHEGLRRRLDEKIATLKKKLDNENYRKVLLTRKLMQHKLAGKRLSLCEGGELYDEYTDLSPLEAQVEELGKRQSLFEAAARDSKWDAGEEEENVR
ncbi:hypothetical protein GUITHDRAFT_139014 [Guillardia theta CCMP2712]|uniref:Uncharacterized protein n=1 Tax=Guillardia theta (strain CCMP2712) TaxID=905079 RepID=L1JBI4_GUITC|nr:hypothetical protein GUITHDRAFT_139014 [Guillardia theta CCMP2712]EKX45450.1 hypothetical protein GUITHDRAFT_139014 [Guillardia theta CCMP2712]|eukprot:XP_005832430.1 hypothetical protein GUITHDRAFT_139014 [Guillardia theta CCMP2712]